MNGDNKTTTIIFWDNTSGETEAFTVSDDIAIQVIDLLYDNQPNKQEVEDANASDDLDSEVPDIDWELLPFDLGKPS